MIVKFDERALYALGFDRPGVEALRHLLYKVGNSDEGPTLPETVRLIQSLSVDDTAPLVADVAELHKEVDALQIEFDSVANVAEISKRIDALQQSIEGLTDLAAQVAELSKFAQFQAVEQVFPPAAIDWEHPGKIGAAAQNSGAFTTLSASGSVALSPANANVVISPSGTGVVTIAPNAVGSLNNVNIGATTPGTIKGTTITATGAVSLSPANANVVLSPTGTGVVTIAPATLGSMDKVAIGTTTPAAAAVTTLTASAAVTISPANAAVTISPSGTGSLVIAPNAASTIDNVDIGATTPKTIKCTTLTTTGAFSLYNGLIFSSGTTGIQFKGSSSTANAEAFFQNDNTALIIHASSSGAVVKALNFCCTGSGTVHMTVASTGVTVAGKFGCNGQAEQAAYAVGAASIDLATVITLANNIRAALIANGIAS